MIKYIGSKRVLVPTLVDIIGRIQPSGSVLDLFSGTSRVGHALKRAGYQVLANDHNAYAATLATCYVQADRERHQRDAARLVAEFNKLPGKPGYFTETFCERSRFFKPKNGARVDAIREEIDRKGLPHELRAVMLASLMEAADRVDSTTGVQMAYLKKWAARASNDLELRVPDLLPRAASGPGRAFQLDALDAVDALDADICYIDPPYNQHKYLGNYHIWESLVLWDKPEVYGIACKRIDCRERGSDFNSKRRSRAALEEVLRRSRAKHLVVSFNDEGYFTRADIEGMLAGRAHVVVIPKDFKRYVGAQIGIYNPRGQKVGSVSHLRNTEYIYVATDDDMVAERVRQVVGDAQVPLVSRSEPTVFASPVGGVGGESPDVEGLSRQLSAMLKARGSLSSSEARAALGVDAASIRRAFRNLMKSGLVYTTGRRRGTRYHWSSPTEEGKGQAGLATSSPPSGHNGALVDAVSQLVKDRGVVTSEEAQAALGLDAATLRPAFLYLIDRGELSTTGQRRGTRYHWVGHVVRTRGEHVGASELPAEERAGTASTVALSTLQAPSSGPSSSPETVPVVGISRQQSLFPQ